VNILDGQEIIVTDTTRPGAIISFMARALVIGGVNVNVLGYIWQVAWANPYTEPPDGVRVKAEMWMPADWPDCRRCPPELTAVVARPGDGYGVFCRSVLPAIKPRLPEALSVSRQAHLRKRLQETVPLFADQFVVDELAREADYYAGHGRGEQMRAKAIQEEHDRLAEIMAMEPGVLVWRGMELEEAYHGC